MITAAGLKERTRDDLAQMAKRKGIAGWYSMRKDQLVRALLRAAKKNGTKSKKTAAASKPAKTAAKRTKRVRVSASSKSGEKTRAAKRKPKQAAKTKTTRTKTTRKAPMVSPRREREKDLSTSTNGHGENGSKKNGNGKRRRSARDRVVLMVRDSYWLHVCWEIRPRSIERIRAAMCEMWHGAKPALRLLEVDSGSTTSTAERVVREVEIHGGVNNWYLDVDDPPRSFRVDLGYLATNGRFYSLHRSNLVTTPSPGGVDTLDQNWSDVARDYERVYALSGGYSQEACTGDLKELFEERLRRPMGSALSARYGVSVGGDQSEFALSVDAELIVYGQTKPDAHLPLAGEPVKLRRDGSFTVRRTLSERRQVLPVVAESRDGLEQRTVILAIDRNTKVMEPITRDGTV